MHPYLIAIILGFIEGLTEFLPVSSTAHLRLMEACLGVSLTSDYWKMFTVIIQLGAILCLPVYFRARIITLFSSSKHLLGLVLAALVVTIIPSFLLVKLIGENLESLFVIGCSLLIGGFVMWIVDALHARAELSGPQKSGGRIRTWKMEDMGFGQAVFIGASQVLAAVFPGTSRSMATIAAGQIAGMSRAAALEFSFFLSMPTMAAATGYDLLKTLFGSGDAATLVDTQGWVTLAIGFVTSFFVAYAAVAWFMAWVRRHGFVPFAIYRIILGVVVLIWAIQAS